MTLITSISGIRGTIGDGLTPPEIVKYTTAYGSWIGNAGGKPKVIVGRDGRTSGEIVKNLVISTLLSMGIDIEDLDYATTPTVEMAVKGSGASGGIIITASHNPENWNALKLLNKHGEFLNESEANQLFEIAKGKLTGYAPVESLGTLMESNDWLSYHVDKILDLDLVSISAIENANYKVLVDVVNSVGAIAIPPLLEKLGVKHYSILNGSLDQGFAHNPEPLPDNLGELSTKVVEGNYDIGIAVDPDVDRLCFVCEDGSFFGEEYTLVSIADYWLSEKPGNTVSNLSSTRALADVTAKRGGNYYASAVGEINVVQEMKIKDATIGGEGNGGVIVPELHYGRDALAGIALFLSLMAKSGKKVSQIRAEYPEYHISKNKIELNESIDVDQLLLSFRELYKDEMVNDIDGVKVDFKDGWVHLRKSNTEPIIRIYTEAQSLDSSQKLAEEAISQIKKLIKQ